MNDGVLGPAVAFAAGVLSFLSPCVLPLVPGYLGHLSGMTLDEIGSRRFRTVAHALMFVLGFSLVFIALGAGATTLGAGLRSHRIALARAGGVLILGFGMYTIGWLPFAPLSRERRVSLGGKPAGLAGSALVGMVFAAGWTPCIGPILGGILTLAGNTADLRRGVELLAAYSAGLALPFLVAAVAFDAFRAWFLRFRHWLPWVQRVSGGLLIGVGLLLITGQFSRLAGWLQGMTPDALKRWL